ncbi:Disease resistance protein RPM1 [Hordeum vulgare]|nr:Disease resistance protein RPM1 [Hordeum vulgare]
MNIAVAAIGSLLPKLGRLLTEEYKLQKSAKKDVKYLQRELKSMHAALSDFAKVPWDDLPEQDMLWAGDITELSHDIEDLVESFPVCVAGSVPPPDAGYFKVLKVKMANLFKMAKVRREIATAVKGVKEQVQEVANRDDRYRGRGGAAVVAAAAPRPRGNNNIDPLLVVLYGDQKTVGTQDATETVIRKLYCRPDDASRRPKVVSIVGFGGIGKTTLAKAVYHKHKGSNNFGVIRFEFSAFVSVSRNPDMKKVLRDLLLQLDEKTYVRFCQADLDEKQLIHLLRELLGNKRYFIVIDDLWDTNAWELISLALMDSNPRSRIITTTRNIGVSEACCSFDDKLIHTMKPLSEGDSKRLFYERIFGTEFGCPPELEQVSRAILMKCGGLPLAIITLAGHLASNQQIKPNEQWYALLQSIGRGLENEGSVEHMKNILSLSYYDLPAHLKTCLMYLSIFPEDYYIDKARLIKRWIAEGFIQGEELFELGESYFNELVNRNMIQPINIDTEGRAKGCRLHDMMLDLICDLSSENNFITILDTIKGDWTLKRNMRRLSLQKSMTGLTSTELSTTSMSQVRSFTVFSPAISQILSLSLFQVLRVLDLEDCDLGIDRNLNLRCVGNLLHLRYLGLRDTKLSEIPMEIGKLRLLQILDLYGVNAEQLPASVVGLSYLMCLHLRENTELPIGYRNMTSLQELTKAYFKDDMEGLRFLTKLRVLSCSWPSECRPEKIDILVKSLSKLDKLHSLEIRSESIDLMESWVPSPVQQLRRIVLHGWLHNLPRFITSSSHPRLSYLSIEVRKVRPGDIRVLGSLPALRYLYLKSVLDSAVEERATESFRLSVRSFPCVTECWFEGVILGPEIFAPGAMPMVRCLAFGVRVSDVLDIRGFNYLSSSIWKLCLLEQVSVHLHGEDARSNKYSLAESHLEGVANAHRNRPKINIWTWRPSPRD